MKFGKQLKLQSVKEWYAEEKADERCTDAARRRTVTRHSAPPDLRTVHTHTGKHAQR